MAGEEDPGEDPEIGPEKWVALKRAGRRVVRFTRSPWVRRVVALGTLAVVGVMTVTLLGMVRHVYFDESDLPDIESLIRFDLPTTGLVYDARGEVIISLANQYRRIVAYDDVPVILRNAILATEDKNFFSHRGVDYSVLPRVLQKSVARSFSAWRQGAGFRIRLPQGGSTLTQQLVRGYFLEARTSQEDGATAYRSGAAPWLLSTALGVPASNKLLRKLEEVRLTLWVEREFLRRFGSRQRAKREIFGRYASFVYMGNGRYGFAAASEYYFARPLGSLEAEDVGEAALLAGISKSPRDYAPVVGDPMPLRRRNEILRLMAGLDYISEDALRHAVAQPVVVVSSNAVKTDAPGVVGHVFSELNRHGGALFGVDDLIQGRIWVQTTADARVQAVVNRALEDGLAAYEKRHPSAVGLTQGSVVVLRNKDGGILAEVGGRQVYAGRAYAYYDYNRAMDSMRQPGSAWKPVVYLAAFRAGSTLDSIVTDEPVAVPSGSGGPSKWIANYDGRFKGPITLRQALAESRNSVAVRLTLGVGVDDVIRTARELGIRSPLKRYVSTALGASEVRLLELANVYRALASGIRAEPHVIDHITNASGDRLYRAARSPGRLRTEGLSEIQEGLRGVVRVPGGTANALDNRNFPVPVMGKTGTTNNFRDALFVGSTYGPEGITVAVRIGFDDSRSLGAQETGGRAALPIFRDVMLGVYASELAGPVPTFPREIEAGIDEYIAATRALADPTVNAPIGDGRREDHGAMEWFPGPVVRFPLA